MIKMINSVGEYVAGEEYEVPRDIPEEVADRFLAAGYAEGEISGDYGTDEWEHFVAEQKKLHQTVGV